MTIDQPSAARLLKRLVPAQDHDALLGDLCEEYQRRRSKAWYFLQILAAIVIGSWKDIRAHKLIALRAIATGVATLALYFRVVLLIGRVVVVLTNGGYYIAGHWLTLPYPPGPPPPYDALPVVAINALGFLLSGWVTVRFHRAHGVAMAMPFLFVTTLMALVLLAILTTDTGPGTRPMPLHQFIAIFGTMFASVPGGVLAGGILALKWKRT